VARFRKKLIHLVIFSVFRSRYNGLRHYPWQPVTGPRQSIKIDLSGSTTATRRPECGSHHPILGRKKFPCISQLFSEAA
jgi:hypothetical protein